MLSSSESRRNEDTRSSLTEMVVTLLTQTCSGLERECVAVAVARVVAEMEDKGSDGPKESEDEAKGGREGSANEGSSGFELMLK